MNNIAKTVGFKPGERNVFFHILTACNLSCSHCYINKQQHGAGQLAFEQIDKWMQIFKAPEKRTNLIFLGGEPTLHPDLAVAVKKAKEYGFFTTVDSNGYLFCDFLQKTTPAELDYLSFSLDGPDPAVNDPIRGEGVFEACVENIRKAVALHFNVSVIYTVSSKNLAHLSRMVGLLEKLKVKRFFIQVLGLRGKSALADPNEISQVSRQEWLQTVPQVAQKAAELGIHVIYPKVFLESGELFECAANVAENYFIFPNGRVYQCPLCEDHPIHSYQIQDNSLVKVEGLREDAFFKLRIAEGCVLNKLLQPDTIEYDEEQHPEYRISCCLLKQEIRPRGK